MFEEYDKAFRNIIVMAIIGAIATGVLVGFGIYEVITWLNK